jgi:O-antigen/teichoic acid export membrane protein
MAAALRLLSPQLFPYTLGAFILLLTTSYSSLLRAVFYIRGRLSYEAAAILVEAGLLLGLTALAISRRASWDLFLWVYSASYLFTCLFSVAVVRWRWHDRLAIRLEPAFWRVMLKAGLPLALGFILTTAYAQLDVVLLQLFKGFQPVGWYSAANKYVDAVAWVPQSAMGAVFPALALLSAGGKDRLALASEKSYRMLALLGLPLAAGMAITADSLVHVTGGFEQSIPALRILAISVFFIFVNNAFIYTLTAMNRQGDFTRLALFTLALNILLNLLLIPIYGYLGAAAGSALTEAGLFLGGWLLLRRQLDSIPVVTSISRLIAATALMAAAVYLLRAASMLLIVPVAIVLYSGLLILLRALGEDEWKVLRAGFTERR